MHVATFGLGIRADIAGIVVWLIPREEIGLPLNTAIENQRFTNISLYMSRWMAQR
jgi:hypothetical protein